MSVDHPAPSTLGFPDDLDRYHPQANSDEAALAVLEALVEDADSVRPARVLERIRACTPASRTRWG